MQLVQLRTLRRTLPILAALLAVAIAARADIVVHKDGRRIEGVVTSDKDGKVKIKTSFGELEFARADIVSIEKGKTSEQLFEEKRATCKSAEDFYQLGLWAKERRMSREAKAAMQKAVDLDPKHAQAQQYFGRVQYKGEWIPPEERDKRQAADEEQEMLARGLVRFQASDGSSRWVTPDEKGHLEKNEVLVDGQWIPFAAAQQLKGLEEFEGKWLPRAEAFARMDVAKVEAILKTQYQEALTDDAILCGPQSVEVLQAVGEGLKRGRAWFDARFEAPSGLALFGGRLAEFYLFTSNDAYTNTADHFAGLTTTVPPGWADAVKKTHGFLWWDPYPLSSARVWNRPPEDLPGHCYHHWGHLLLNRLGYDGRLIPPWFDEGVAAVLEFRSHGRNAVFCRGSKTEKIGPSTGGPSGRKPDTKAGKPAGTEPAVAPFDPKAMRNGNWKGALIAGLSELPPFDQLASLQFDELEAADIAASMAIVEWIESRGPGSLRKFHDVLRKTAPPAPTRVLPNSFDRERVYEEAFKAATGMGWREADQAWRRWITGKQEGSASK